MCPVLIRKFGPTILEQTMVGLSLHGEFLGTEP